MIIKNLFGFTHVQPVHQGRTAENILFKTIFKPGDIVVSNTHFETTRSNIESLGCTAIDMLKPEPPFCGNLDIAKLKRLMAKTKRVRMVVLTITNNINGGQPVSLDNIVQTWKRTQHKNTLLVFDASRFAGNVFLIKEYTKSKMDTRELCKKIFNYADIVYMSCKKDGLSNIGGFIAVKDNKLFERLSLPIIQQESYPSAGGLAARDLTAMTIGLQESLNENFLNAYIRSIRELASVLKKHKVKIFEPVGGHAVAILLKSGKPYSAFALAAKVFLETGIRGGVFEDIYRLAVPRRVYTNEQLRYVGEAVSNIYHKKLFNLKLVNRPPQGFFNFFAKFRRI